MADIFENADALGAAFDKLAYHLEKNVLVKAAKAGAELIRAEAERRAPRLTGELAEHQIVSIAGTGSTAAEVTVKIGPDRKHFYGMFDEFGTAHQTAEPFLGPALESQHDAALEVAQQVLAQEIEKYS